jgi:acetaldehyde dehydrogenase
VSASFAGVGRGALTPKIPSEVFMSKKLKVAIIGPGNIGTDLMIKIMRHGEHLEMGAMVGIDPQSDGLARAQRMGVATTHEGVEGLSRLPIFADIDIVFDATSAGAHVRNDAFLRALKPSIRMVDLTPAAIGPYCIPVDRKSTRLNSSHRLTSRMPSSA